MAWHSLSLHRQRDGRIEVLVYSRPTHRTWALDGLPEVVSPIATPRQLGEAVVRGLRRSLQGKCVREDPDFERFLAWNGAFNWSSYSRGVRAVDVVADFEDEIGPVGLTPQVRVRDGDFIPMMKKTVIVDGTDVTALGDAARRAMTQAGG
ncbi:MAG: hypothetical protein FJW64_15300 [Actinobacteria bacterium]|nr:hypothetical protein [Actinomycetota bacterium]